MAYNIKCLTALTYCSYRGPRQQDQELQASLGFMKPCFKKKTKTVKKMVKNKPTNKHWAKKSGLGSSLMVTAFGLYGAAHFSSLSFRFERDPFITS